MHRVSMAGRGDIFLSPNGNIHTVVEIKMRYLVQGIERVRFFCNSLCTAGDSTAI